MTFLLSKILWIILNPFNLILIGILLIFILRIFKFFFLAKLLFFLTATFFFIVSILPTGAFLTYTLEKKFHQNIIPENLDGILILSGATNPYMTKEYDQVSLNGSVERLTESINLIKKFPNAKIVFAGGSGSLIHADLSHSSVAKRFYKNLNINIKNFYFEEKSRNTYENIIYSKQKIKPKKDEKWLLITSAFHLTRALNVAERHDWILIPYATDYQERKEFKWKISFNFLSNLSKFQHSTHEWVGLIAYYFMGRTSKIY